MNHTTLFKPGTTIIIVTGKGTCIKGKVAEAIADRFDQEEIIANERAVIIVNEPVLTELNKLEISKADLEDIVIKSNRIEDPPYIPRLPKSHIRPYKYHK